MPRAVFWLGRRLCGVLFAGEGVPGMLNHPEIGNERLRPRKGDGFNNVCCDIHVEWRSVSGAEPMAWYSSNMTWFR